MDRQKQSVRNSQSVRNRQTEADRQLRTAASKWEKRRSENGEKHRRVMKTTVEGVRLMERTGGRVETDGGGRIRSR